MWCFNNLIIFWSVFSDITVFNSQNYRGWNWFFFWTVIYLQTQNRIYKIKTRKSLVKQNMLKGIICPNRKFSHYLLMLMSFQTRMTLFLMWNTKKDILKFVTKQFWWPLASILWTKTHKQILFYALLKNKVIQVWNNMRASKCWPNFHFGWSNPWTFFHLSAVQLNDIQKVLRGNKDWVFVCVRLVLERVQEPNLAHPDDRAGNSSPRV